MGSLAFSFDAILALLPDWAIFAGAVIECPDLTPTLDRNDVIRHEPAFVALKQALAQRLTETVQRLAEQEPRTFRQLRSDHLDRFYRALLSNYAEDEKFFRAVINHMPFSVVYRGKPEGEHMTLPRYRDEVAKRQKPRTEERQRIYFLDDPASMGQYKAMIVQRDIPVILTLHGAEPPLLRAYGTAFSDEVVIEDVRAILDLYVEEVDQAPYEAMKQFLSSLDGGGPDEVRASRFEPSYIPAVLIVKSHANPEQANILERILKEGGNVFDKRVSKAIEDQLNMAKLGRSQITVCLNDNNGVIRLIRDHCIRGAILTGTIADVLHEVYHTARIHSEPRGEINQHFFEHRNGLLARLLEVEQQLPLIQTERDQLALQLKGMQSGPKVPPSAEPRDCTLMLTDLRGSTRMVGFLDRAESAEILRNYARKMRSVIEQHGGRVDKFTGDGVFAYFGMDSGRPEIAVSAALACANEVNAVTMSFFQQGEIAQTLAGNAISIAGCRTLLHSGRVMFGEFAGVPALVGPQVVALFRASGHDELFARYPVIITEQFLSRLNPANRPEAVARQVVIDKSLPPLTFYPHPAFVGGGGSQ